MVDFTKCYLIVSVNNNTGRVYRCPVAIEETPKKEIWETWYFWLGVGIILILLVTALIAFLATSIKKKYHNIIRIGNLSEESSVEVISTTSGPGGIIQPNIHHVNACVQTDEGLAGPLNPPYPAVEPVSIVRGSAPPDGFRQTGDYTEIVLPPGYVDNDHYKP